MRLVIQRVTEASVKTEERENKIQQGILILLGVEETDSQEDIEWLCNKVVKMRIFNDDSGVMNLSLKDIDGEALVVSQFTLHASTKKGNRPSYIKAAKPEIAIPMYENFIAELEKTLEKKVATGVFGAHMEVSLVNNGPVTIIIDSKSKE